MSVFSFLCCNTRDEPFAENERDIAVRSAPTDKNINDSIWGQPLKGGLRADAGPPFEEESAVDEDDPSSLWPQTLFVACSKGGHGGTYRIVEGVTVNDLPLWKKEDSDEWVFNGIGGQWFVGDRDEQKLDFNCDHGNIASFEPAMGRMPDEIGAGGWLLYVGLAWYHDSDINITSECFTLEDQIALFERGKQQINAALTIQSRFRGAKGRKDCRTAKIEKEARHRAAVTIQRKIRLKQAGTGGSEARGVDTSESEPPSSGQLPDKIAEEGQGKPDKRGSGFMTSLSMFLRRSSKTQEHASMQSENAKGRMTSE